MSPTHLEILENLPKLPDDLIVSDQITAILLNCSTRSLRRIWRLSCEVEALAAQQPGARGGAVRARRSSAAHTTTAR